MATAKELFDSGHLQAAIDQLTAEVKASPTDVSRRTFLFELLCFAGEWDRAEKQLEVIGHQDVKAEIGVQIYHHNIAAERLRRRVFTEGQRPKFLAKPPEYVLLHLMAVNQIKEGDYEAARRLLDQAEEARPALAGRFNDQPFEDFRDANELVAPALELIAQGEYVWLPFEQIHGLEISPPAQLRDLLWARARIETTEAVGGFAGEAFVPALYSGSEKDGNNQVRLGRMTDWRQVSEDFATPLGLRLFIIGDEDLAIFDLEKIEFSSAAARPPSETT